MILKFASLFVVLLAISGCTTFYTFNGKPYESLEKFQKAVDDDVSASLSNITPLPSPLTQKKLIFAIPSAVAITDEETKWIVKTQGKEPSSNQKEVGLNINRANFKSMKVYFDAIIKRNIYASTQFIEMNATTGEIAASADNDTLFVVMPAPYSSQWYYTSHKQGKQVFSYDRSSPTGAGKVQAFVDSVQTMAIRD